MKLPILIITLLLIAGCTTALTPAQIEQRQMLEEWLSMTGGSIATGTVLTREGVAVAELWAMKRIGATGAEVVDLTSHDSSDRFREFLQGLRERDQFELLGHHLPDQTTEWIDDFHDPTHRHYQVTTPDGETYDFCGWVRRVKVHGELEGAIAFQAGVTCTEGPLTRDVTTTEYYHCTEAPPAPGTSPDDDPDHWEEVDPPGDLEDGEAVLGYDQVGASREYAWVRGAVLPFPHGTPTNSVNDSLTDGTSPPATVTWADDSPKRIYSIYATYDAETRQVQAGYFYGSHDGADFQVCIYDEAGNLLDHTSTIKPPLNTPGWYGATFANGIVLSEGTNYVVTIWASTSAQAEIWADNLADYTPPDGNEWDPDEEYEYCQTVSITTTTEEQYCP